jgi:hypothetical protein
MRIKLRWQANGRRMILSLSGGAWECASHIPEDKFVLDVE